MPDKPQPVEVFLTKANIAVTCKIYRDDETGTDLDARIDSLSMRGAQREITSWLISQGYKPAGRWTYEADTRNVRGDDLGECRRSFRPGPQAEAV
jgi:hypothetical protein